MHLLPLLCLTIATPSEPEALHDKLLHATAWVRAGSEGVGAGWVVDAERRLLVTNLHVVGERDRVEAVFFDGPISDRDHYLEHQQRLREEGRSVAGKVIRREPKSDLALIELEKLPKGVAALPLAERVAGPGEWVQAIGHRQDSEALWNSAQGEVRQVGPLTDGYFWRGKKLAVGVPCLIIQMPIQPGDSGGPVVNAKGEVVGVLSGLRGPQSAIAIQASQVRMLLGQVKDEPKGEAGDLYRRILPAVVWVRPTATEGRGAGWVIDKKRKLILTTNTAAGSFDLVDVIFPRFKNGELQAETAAYSDRIGQRQDGYLVRGLVLERDPKRDLALIELESLPEGTVELPLAEKTVDVAQCVQTINHPSNVEHLWLHSAGSVRQKAMIELSTALKGKPEKVAGLLLQLPGGAASGGPVVNESGESVGVLAVKDGQAVAVGEVKGFMDAARGMYEPRTAEEHRRRGSYLRMRHRAEAALEHYRKAAAMAPQERAFARELAIATFDAGRGDEAIDLAKKLVQSGREAIADDFACLAYVYGRSPDAVRWAQKAIEANDKCGLAYLVRGLIGRDLADLDRAIELDPNSSAAYGARADWHLGKDDDKAIADWSRAIELSPYEWKPLFHRSVVLLERWNHEKNDPRRCIADLERLIDLDPKGSAYHQRLAKAYLKKGDETKGIEQLVAAVRWNKDADVPAFRRVIERTFLIRRLEGDDSPNAMSWVERSLGALRPHVPNELHREQMNKIIEATKTAKPAEVAEMLNELVR